MSTDQAKLSIPKEDKKPETYSEWAARTYGEKKETWTPWLEDMYLRWFGKDNKASYATKQQLDKTKVTGVEQVDNLQDGVNGLVSSQVGKGGLLQPVGDFASKEGINRAERKGRDDEGNWAPGPASKVANPIAENAKAGGSQVVGGAKAAGGYVGGLFGGGNKEEKK